MNNVIYFNGGGVSNVQSGEHKMAILESIQNVSSGLTSSIWFYMNNAGWVFVYFVYLYAMIPQFWPSRHYITPVSSQMWNQKYESRGRIS